MNDWCEEIESALAAFVTVAALAKEPIRPDELKVEFLGAPHRPPSSLPAGKMAIYAFWWNGQWLKIGKAGPNSGPRYISQHYTGSAMSTLSGSLANDTRMYDVLGFDRQRPGDWIKKSTCRVNILVSSNRHKELLSLLETFLHARLRPIYEG
jgi:hypothetical protein